jgi:hypothetical protein
MPAEDFAGQPVDVIGFVFRDERLAADQVHGERASSSAAASPTPTSRAWSCQWPETAALTADAMGAACSGVLAAGEFNERTLPVVVADADHPG